MIKALVVDYSRGTASVLVDEDLIIDIATARKVRLGELINLTEEEVEIAELSSKEKYQWGDDEGGDDYVL